MIEAKITKQGEFMTANIGFLKHITAAAVFVAGAPVMAEATAFDLLCKGSTFEGVEKAESPAEFTIRIDLEAKKYCWKDCEMIRDIFAVHPDRIVFIGRDPGSPRGRIFSKAEVSRKTGQFEHLVISTRPVPMRLEWKMSCEPTAFSGFPEVKF